MTDDKDREEKIRRNREKYPEIAALVDQVRKYFPEAKVTSIRKLTPQEQEENWKRRMEKKYQAPTNRGRGVRVLPTSER